MAWGATGHLTLVALAAGCLPAPTPPSPRFLLHRHLVTEAFVAHRFGAHDASRYLSLLRVPDAWATRPDEHWLFLKNGSWPNAALRSSLLAFAGCGPTLKTRDGGSCVRGGVEVLRGAREAHNAALRFDAGPVLWGLAGLTSPAHPETELLLARSAPLNGSLATDATTYPRLGYRAEGCVERRAGKDGCEYDGRLSLAASGGRAFLYARANTNPRGGGRHVQVARLRRGAWSPFAPVKFARGAEPPYDVLGDGRRATESADIYYAAVDANPADEATLLGLFPTVVAEAGRDGAAILAAVSCDGAHFSPPEPLLNSSHVGGEIVDHVVDGLARDGDDVLVFVHAGVPGTAEKACAYKALFPKPGVKRRAPTGWRPPPSEVVALRVPLANLRRFTDRARAHLPGCRGAPT